MKVMKLNVLGMVQNMMLRLVNQLSIQHGKQFQFIKIEDNNILVRKY